jgi:hypothetical protein
VVYVPSAPVIPSHAGLPQLFNVVHVTFNGTTQEVRHFGAAVFGAGESASDNVVYSVAQTGSKIFFSVFLSVGLSAGLTLSSYVALSVDSEAAPAANVHVAIAAGFPRVEEENT